MCGEQLREKIGTINTHQVPECLIKTLDNDKYCWLGQTVALMTDSDTCYPGLCESETHNC